jgi:hypothetical protein
LAQLHTTLTPQGDTKLVEWLQINDARASYVLIVIFKERTG